MSFDERVVLVTGGGSGIGRETAAGLARMGATVIIADWNKAAAEAVSAEISRNGYTCIAVETDVSRSASCDEVVAFAVRQFGALDILVNNAAYGLFGDLTNVEDEPWHAVLQTVLSGTFYMCRAAARTMRDHAHCRIINMSSAAGIRGISKRGAYGAAKGGVATLTKALAIELGPRGITVNAVAPGPIETPMVAGHSDQTRQGWLRLLAIRRYGTPAEVAAAIYFLASKEAAYVTGHVLSVDGGFAAGGTLEPSE